MVLVDLRAEEIKALDIIYEDARPTIRVGTVLGLLRIKIQEAINKEARRLAKKKAEDIVAEGKKKDGKKP